MAKKTKFYSVAVGRRPGIYTDWAETEKQVKNFAGARYKSFGTRQEAEAWFKQPVYATKGQKKTAGSGREQAVRARIPDGAVVVHTDGGAIGNPGPGGYGVVIDWGDKREELSGGYQLTTNNRMEMMAAIVALEKLQECRGRRPIVLFSDSSYLVNGFTKGWVEAWQRRGWKKSDGGEVMNIDLWQRLVELADGLDIRFQWLKGHAGHAENERCDRLAVAAARGTALLVDEGYSPGG